MACAAAKRGLNGYALCAHMHTLSVYKASKNELGPTLKGRRCCCLGDAFTGAARGRIGACEYMRLLLFRPVAIGRFAAPTLGHQAEMRSISKELGASGAMRRNALRKV